MKKKVLEVAFLLPRKKMLYASATLLNKQPCVLIWNFEKNPTGF